MAEQEDPKKRTPRSDEDVDTEEGHPEPIRDTRPPVDSYTGEPIPAQELPNYPVSESSFADAVENVPLDEDEALEFLANERGADDEVVMNEVDDYTDDEEVLADFAERQDCATGSREIYESLMEHTAHSPGLSGEDIDADWGSVDVSGEESVGGSVPTPDQDIVEELGEALGITYEDDEELNTFDKLAKRDEERYEMDPESGEEE